MIHLQGPAWALPHNLTAAYPRNFQAVKPPKQQLPRGLNLGAPSLGKATNGTGHTQGPDQDPAGESLLPIGSGAGNRPPVATARALAGRKFHGPPNNPVMTIKGPSVQMDSRPMQLYTLKQIHPSIYMCKSTYLPFTLNMLANCIPENFRIWLR